MYPNSITYSKDSSKKHLTVFSLYLCTDSVHVHPRNMTILSNRVYVVNFFFGKQIFLFAVYWKTYSCSCISALMNHTCTLWTNTHVVRDIGLPFFEMLLLRNFSEKLKALHTSLLFVKVEFRIRWVSNLLMFFYSWYVLVPWTFPWSNFCVCFIGRPKVCT